MYCFITSRQHISHATYMDMFEGVQFTPLYPRNIPDVATFQANARGSAVNNSDHVVIYENTGMFGYFMGGRAWWMFKVGMNKRNESVGSITDFLLFYNSKILLYFLEKDMSST